MARNNQLVFTHILKGVKDHFDANSLWQEKHGGKKGIMSLEDKEEERLRYALDSFYPEEIEKKRDGFKEVSRRVYTDVVVWIPEAIWRDDIQTGGRKMEMLANNLSWCHRRDFGEILWGEREPSYVIMPEKGLDFEQVRFQFGWGVFVPNEKDQQVATVQFRLDKSGQWVDLPEWLFWKEKKITKRPAGIYQAQYGLSVSFDAQCAAVCLAGTEKECEGASPWRGSIFINPSLQIPGFAFGDDRFISDGRVEEGDGPNSTSVFAFERIPEHPSEDVKSPEGLAQEPPEDTKTFFLKIEPLRSASSVSAPMRGQGHPTPSIGSTSPHAQEPPKASPAPADTPQVKAPHLVLGGLALPRIDGRKEIKGLEGLAVWTLCLDERGNPVKENSLDALALLAGADRDFLSVRSPGKSRADGRITSYPWVYEWGGGKSLRLMAPPDALGSDYFGFLEVPLLIPFSIPLERGRPIILGRSTLVKRDKPDVCIDRDVFGDTKGFLGDLAHVKWRDALLGSLLLEGRHVEIRLSRNGDSVEVKQIGVSFPIYALPSRGAPCKRLPGDSEPMILREGDRLLLGFFLLQFMRTPKPRSAHSA